MGVWCFCDFSVGVCVFFSSLLSAVSFVSLLVASSWFHFRILFSGNFYLELDELLLIYLFIDWGGWYSLIVLWLAGTSKAFTCSLLFSFGGLLHIMRLSSSC